MHRQLIRLAATSLLRVETVGNQKFYQANERSPVFAELCGLVRKTIGLAGPLAEALEPLADRVTAAFVCTAPVPAPARRISSALWNRRRG